jgi:hypothetical protein
MSTVPKEVLDREREQAAIWEMIAHRLARRLSEKEGRSTKEIVNAEYLDITGEVAFTEDE